VAIPHICACCLDVKSPVERSNGQAVGFGEAGEVQVEFYLHYKCAPGWWQEFDTDLLADFGSVRSDDFFLEVHEKQVAKDD
jgi:hypothetical protein